MKLENGRAAAREWERFLGCSRGDEMGERWQRPGGGRGKEVAT
jgi:hypothetical protein